MIFILQAMHPNEVGKFGEMPFFLQYLTAEVGLRHHSIEVRWHDAIESAADMS